MIRFLKDSFIKKYKVFDSKLFFGNSLINFLIKININMRYSISFIVWNFDFNSIFGQKYYGYLIIEFW